MRESIFRVDRSRRSFVRLATGLGIEWTGIGTVSSVAAKGDEQSPGATAGSILQDSDCASPTSELGSRPDPEPQALLYDNGSGGIVYVFQVDGNAMAPNLPNGTVLLVDPLAYEVRPPARADIIVFDPPTISDNPYIKRVIGLPGDTVTIEEGNVYRNSEYLDEPYILDNITDCPRSSCGPVVVSEGEVYVLGDNRMNSLDSRIFGPIAISTIYGRAWLAIDAFTSIPLV